MSLVDRSHAPESDPVNDSPIPLDALWRQFGEQFRRRARTRLRQYGLSGQAESMDICNDVMVDLARRVQAGGAKPDEVLAYILRAIDNQVIDTFRTLARGCRDFRRNEAAPPEHIQPAAEATSASQVALRREILAKIRSQLSDQDRLAVDMMLQNFAWSEIGQRLGIQADAARMRVQRAIEKVRRELGVFDESSS